MGLQNHGGASSAGATAGQIPHADGLGQFAWADPTTWNPESHPWNVKIDRVTTNGASMSSTVNPTQLTVSGITFTGADVGKMIRVDGAGAAGASLKTTITGSASGKAILASPCLTDVSNVRVMYGTDNATALDTLFRALEDFSAAGKPRSVEFRDGVAMHTSTLVFPLRGTIKTSQENWTNYDFQYGPNVHAERKGGFVFYQAWDQNVDCARVQSDDAGTLHQWFGKLSGFTIEQDIENTAGIGLNFTDPQDNPVLVIDGGQLEHIAVMGTAQSGINFADGIVTGVLIQPYVFATGWYDRALFTADTHGTDTLTNVSSFTGLAVGREVWGIGFPLGAMIKAIDSGAGTIQLTSAVTGTSAGVAVEQYGKGGILYQSRGSGQVTFLGASGDQNSGGLIRFIGAGGGAVNTESVVLIGTKNEFGANVYRGGDDSLWATTGSSPQGASAIVYDNAQGMKISVVGLYHHADASSATDSSTPNTKGRKIGPAQLVAPTGPPPGCVSWESLAFHFASAVNPPSSDQIALYDGNTGQSLLHFIRGKGEYNSGSFSAEMSYSGGSHRLHSFGSSGLFQGPGAGYGESVGWQIAGSTPVISWYNGAAPTGKQLIGWFTANDGSFRLRGLQSAANSYVTDFDAITVTRDAPGGGMTYLRYTRHISDVNATLTASDEHVGWSALTAARTANLPSLVSCALGTTIAIADETGNASATKTITFVPNGTDAIAGRWQVNTPNAKAFAVHYGTKWVCFVIQGREFRKRAQVSQRLRSSLTSAAASVTFTDGGALVGFTRLAMDAAAAPYEYQSAPLFTKVGNFYRPSSFLAEVQQPWRIAFDFGGQQFRVFTNGASGSSRFRVWVNEQPSAWHNLPTDGVDLAVLCDLGARGYYRIVLEGDGVSSPFNFGGIDHLPTDPVYPPSVPPSFRFAIVGDSFAIGQGATAANIGQGTDGYSQQLAKMLGCNTFLNHSRSSTGWIRESTGTVVKYGNASRVAELIAWKPDVILAQGSINDSIAGAGGSGTIGPQITAWYATIKAALPDTFVVLTGVPRMYTATAQDLLVNADIKASAVTLGLPFIDPQTATIGPWFTGTGAVGATTGDGPADFYAAGGSNIQHPSPAGHTALASRIYRELSEILGLNA